MKILLVTGGDSSERKISLLSAREVKKALLKNAYQVKIYDLLKGYDQLQTLSQKFDVLFPVLHGEEGEGGKLHEFLSKLGKPVVGSKNYKGFKNAWYKIPFKKYCDKHNILTPKWTIINKPKDIDNFGFPCVAKTSSGGSSREVYILKSKLDLEKQIKTIFTHKDLFAEEFISGKEITVGILNDKALPIIEIIPPKDSWFNYKNKYSGETREIVNSPSVDLKTKKEIQKIALKVHKFFNLGSYSRVDFMLDEKNRIYILELNTIPGLTSQSLLPKETGMSFEKFIDLLVKLALKQ